MTPASSSARTRLRQLGQYDLSAWVEAAHGMDGERGLWSVQRRIGAAASKRRARVSVPSCTASGKTYLAARLALAFYDAYTPGTPCDLCRGPCGGAKVITLASKFEHLRAVLWGEIRTAHAQLQEKGIDIPGVMARGQNLRLDNGPDHFMLGQSPHAAEGLQGFHGPHILVLGDEATALPESVTQGLASTLATGDARLLLIFNPTTPDTWAAQQTRSDRTEVIKIRAWDTPHFTGEHVPLGSFLLDPETLEDMKGNGGGPGTYDWTTKVEADFWEMGDDVLIPGEMYDRGTAVEYAPGTRQLGIDLAPYGSDENVIAFRDGNALVRMKTYPAMRQELFWAGPVMDAVRAFNPDYLSWDADGVGSGVYGYAEDVMKKHNQKGGNVVLLPFRGGVKVSAKFINSRAAWWWSLRRRFEDGRLALMLPPDEKLRAQVTDIRYSITDSGDIKAETKKQMKDRGTESPDRGDAFMYAFAMVEELPTPAKIVETPVSDLAGVRDHSIDAMWRRNKDHLRRKRTPAQTPWQRLAPGQDAWDDL